MYCLPACWHGCVPGLPGLDPAEEDGLDDLEVLGELEVELLPVVDGVPPVEEGEGGVGSDEGTKKSVIRCYPVLEKRESFIPSRGGMMLSGLRLCE